jgi:tetratricopeptide (TPR) repeat protein
MSLDLREIAKIYLWFGLLEEAEKLLGEARAISGRAGDLSGEADAVLILSTIRSREGRYDEALELLEESYGLFREDKNDRGAATALNNQGSIAIRRGEYEKAAGLIDDAISIQKREKNHTGLAAAYSNRGFLNELLGKRELSLADYTLALEEDRFMENSLGISSDLNRLAEFHLKGEDLEEALFYFKRALDVNRELKVVGRMMSDLESIISILDTLGREEEKELYQEALGELESIPPPVIETR